MNKFTCMTYSFEFLISGPTHSDINISLLYNRNSPNVPTKSKFVSFQSLINTGHPPN